jgi:DHA1 family bicyclomycin/chloramphenicol resistance-like MFS transporter
MAPFSRNAGTASALMGGIQLAVGALTSGIVSVLTNSTALPMAGVMASCALLSFCILLAGRKVIRYNATLLEVQEESAEMISTS